MRRDGNCFYLSFIFSLLEEMLNGLKSGDTRVREAHAVLIEKIKGSKELFLQQNYQEVVRKVSHHPPFDVFGNDYHAYSTSFQNEF